MRRALARWRGPPLADLSYEPFAQTEIARLDELRLLALESRIDADLAAGRAEELVPELDALVREHPPRERAHGQLMLALYRSGRQADALEAYRRMRRVLDKELGLEPGPGLRELEQAILRQDSALEKPRRPPAVLRGRGGAPALLATCAHLLNYPDEAAPAGSRLVPEVAAAKPVVSAGGRTYTFTVRPGFRFSPPSNEPVTALTFKHSIERALHPRTRGGAAPLLADIVGARAFMAGKARHIAGIVARGRTLTIHLVAPSGDLPARLSMPSFCAVPLDAPVDPKGLIGIPAAGPYYVASHTPGAQVVLKRNPNYHGERPHRLAEVDIRIGVGQEEELRDVEAGKADYAAGGIPSSARERLAARYGPGSAAARNGHQMYFTNPGLNVRFLILNTERPLFSDPRLRRAVNYAVDRPALVAEMRRHFSSGLFGGGRPTDQYLPSAIRGYSSRPLYPLGGPDLATARRLAGGQHRSAVLFACNKPPCPQIAAIVKRNLAEIGIEVHIQEMPTAVMFARAEAPRAPFDILLLGWFADYPDPANFLNVLFSRHSSVVVSSANYSHFSDPEYERELAAAARLSGAKRFRAYSELARRLARDAAPAVAYETEESRDFFSARIGCQVYQPVYGMDIGALCLRS